MGTICTQFCKSRKFFFFCSVIQGLTENLEKLYNAVRYSINSVVTINNCVLDTPIGRMFVCQMTENFGTWE